MVRILRTRSAVTLVKKKGHSLEILAMHRLLEGQFRRRSAVGSKKLSFGIIRRILSSETVPTHWRVGTVCS
jgi:hypothetical protein